MTCTYIRLFFIIVLVAVTCPTRTDAAVVFTVDTTADVNTDPDPTAWASMFNSTILFETEAANIALADEVVAVPVNNTFGLGGASATLTFNSANTGLPWSFTVAAPGSTSPLDNATGFTYNDTESISIFRTGALSPGDIGNHVDDDVTFTFTAGPDLFGFGFEIVHSSTSATYDETVQVFGAGSVLLGTYHLPVSSSVNHFIGIKSDTPITQVVFDDEPGSDDLAIRDFQFGSTIPEASSCAALSIALAGILVWKILATTFASSSQAL